jgi:hypothetical protein
LVEDGRPAVLVLSHKHHQETESAGRQAGDRQLLEIRIRAVWKGWKLLAEAVEAALTIQV